MKNYKVIVNGNQYEVAIELLSETAAAAPIAAPATPTPVATSAAAPAGGEKVSSPMPGNILAVNVSVGDMVKKGDVLMVLEAMKMENEISSPVDGKITFVGVQKGETVESGTALCTIE